MAAKAIERVLKSPLLRQEAFIGGAWVGARDGLMFEVRNPSTREAICSVPDMNTHDAADAIEKAHAARSNWGGLLAKVELCVLCAPGTS